ncbi:MAG: NADPH-dependent glutamate synthase [bacterium]|nr:NADPH-dependent glutamate synthase [bacterium]
MTMINPKQTPMLKQDPKVRAKNFHEVGLGYTKEEAITEAKRCLKCKKAMCISGCPVNVDIPVFIASIMEGNFDAALQSIKTKNSLPGVCGRVCPQEDQCEKKCILGIKNEPVSIGRLERAAADFGKVSTPVPDKATKEKVAVVGAGPAGLTIAGDLARLGYQVTVFEALHKPGGVLVYGIPEFRLPKAIVDQEVESIKKLGVDMRVDQLIGRTFTIDDLKKDGYKAIFVASGAGFPKFMNIPGENLNGVYSANEFLTRVNLMKAYLFPGYDTPIKKAKRVAVIGGGNVAMDSARTALRLGAEKVFNVYRRSRKEMPARVEEIENAIEEGIQMEFLVNPIRILDDGNGWVKGLECLRMELGACDESGRCRPVPIKGSEFILDVEQVIIAIGTSANPLISATTPDLKVNKWGYVEAEEATGQTSKTGVFAGGDIVTGSATVISAMGAARKSAEAIAAYLEKK